MPSPCEGEMACSSLHDFGGQMTVAAMSAPATVPEAPPIQWTVELCGKGGDLCS